MERALGLRSAIAVNTITMIGIGPLVTIPLVLQSLAGPLALIGWIAGAVVALCDGFVWAELSSLFPGSGGTYVYLRNAFGPERAGRGMAFIFNWQFLLAGPCLIASGYIGFANYAGYLFPALAQSAVARDAVAAAVGLVTLALLFAPTRRVGVTGMALAIAAFTTIAFVSAAGYAHADLHRAFTLAAPLRFDAGFLAGLGSALFITLYDYAGYSAAALLGDEVKEPNRTIPRAIIGSVILVALAYLALQIGVLGAIDWRTLFDASGAPTPQSLFVGSIVVEHAWGRWAAGAVTVLVLVTAFASVFGNLLGYSRIPFAAARDRAFFPAFAALHPKLHIPHRSLLVIGLLSIAACAFTLDQVIAFLTAGIVLIQGVAQIVALFVVRRKERGGYRMPLYPIPAIIALAGWLLAFYYSGPVAIALGAAWLLVGCILFLFYARVSAVWPFAAGLLCALSLLPHAASAAEGQWASWHTAQITSTAGTPAFSIDGQARFVYGAAFFYERIPANEWQASLRQYRAMGINTIDLYVMWNWHEPHEGQLDFDGHSDPRRNLKGLLAMIHGLGMHVILRPGPVIRNEWRNGGYPDWLLSRPEYNMPLHDILEGRYPATATFQNAHADSAAAEWLNNSTHLTYAQRWLTSVLRAVEPYAHDVIAIAIDDDQGAYIDNDTWPGPNWQRYINTLAGMVRTTAGPRVPLFINTFQMKVTASSPVWAWGNWYQSDAFTLGDHDLAQLTFSTLLLGTQPGKPLMGSEFQAGWLQGADELHPRGADPDNTTIALHQMLQLGMHGVVNFPVQDTLDPPGQEAPWTNIVYGWDAALARSRCGASFCTNPRYQPTAEFGALIAAHPELARMRPQTDVAILWPVSAYDAATLSNADIGKLAADTIAELQACRAARLSCRLFDARYEQAMPRERFIVTANPLDRDFVQPARDRLAAIAASRRSFSSVDDALHHGLRTQLLDKDAALLTDGKTAVFDVFNDTPTPLQTRTQRVTVGSSMFRIPRMTVEAMSACDAFLPNGPTVCTHRTAATTAPLLDALPSDTIELRNGGATIAISPGSGARAFVFTAGAANAFNSIGAFRDDVATPPSPSARDYIAQYTHPLEAGTFNRTYACERHAATLRCSYTAPDLGAHAVTFVKTYELLADGTLRVALRCDSDAVALLPVTAAAHVSVGNATLEQATKDGYVLDRIHYRAGVEAVVTVEAPGAAPQGQNRP